MSNIETVPAKSILTKVNSRYGWFGVDYNINLYKGCCHGCIYCDSRSSCYQIGNFDRVRVKENAIPILERELRSKRSPGIVGMGAMSDTYSPHERELCLTRSALALFARYGFGVSLETKSDLVVRDIPLFQEILLHSDVIVKLSVSAAEDALAKKLEPNAPAPSRRFAALRALSHAGIFCGILLMPVLPYLTDTAENILHIVQLAKENGAKFVCAYSLGMTLREGQREYYFQKLDVLFPGLRERYVHAFGNQYACGPENRSQLQQIFQTACEENGLLWRMEDIVAAYKTRCLPPVQLSLYE